MMTKFFLLGKPVIKALRGGLPRRLGRILFVAINIGFRKVVIMMLSTALFISQTEK